MASRLRPRTISELLDAEFELLRRHYPSFLTIVAAGFAPMIALAVAFGIGGALVGGGSKGASSSPAFVGLIVVGVITVIACVLVLQAALIFAISDAYLDDRVDVADAFRRATSNIPTTFGAYGLTALLVFAGYILLIIPGIYVALGLFAVPAIALLENRSPSDAVTRSFALTKGRKLKVMGALFVAWVISFVVSMTINVTGSITGSVGVAAAAQIVSFVALYPVTTVMAVLLYYDARIRHEGYDIERAAATLGPAQGA